MTNKTFFFDYDLQTFFRTYFSRAFCLETLFFQTFLFRRSFFQAILFDRMSILSILILSFELFLVEPFSCSLFSLCFHPSPDLTIVCKIELDTPKRFSSFFFLFSFFLFSSSYFFFIFFRTHPFLKKKFPKTFFSEKNCVYYLSNS
jgi:hypothetical protein